MRASRMQCEDKRDRTDHDERWTRIEVPAVAEDREGWEIASSSSFGDDVLAERIVWLRRGDLISVVSLGGDGDLDRVDLDSLVRLAADKLTLVGTMPDLPSWVGDCEREPTPIPSVPTGALARGVLRDEDMRQGWIEIARDECGLFESDAYCDPVQYDPPIRGIAQVSVSLEHGAYGAFFHGVRLYAEGDAQERMRWIGETHRASASCIATFYDERFTWRLSPIEFDVLGDETVAYELSTRIDNIDYVYTYVEWRRGDAISTVGYLESHSDALADIVEAADAKFAAAAEEINRLNR